MKRSLFAALFLLAGLLTAPAPVASATSLTCPNGSVVWTGLAQDGIWDDPANWSTAAVPTAADDVCLDGATPQQLVTVSDGVAAEAKSIVTVNDVFVLIETTGSLALQQASDIENIFVKGSLTNAGTLSLSKLLIVNGGSLTGSGLTTGPDSTTAFADPNGATMNEPWVSKGEVQFFNGDLHMNNGSLDIVSGKFLAASVVSDWNIGGAVNVRSGATLEIHGAASVVAPSITTATNSTLRVHGTTLTTNVTSAGTFETNPNPAITTVFAPKITGSFTQTGGTFVVRTTGLAADKLTVTGAATINGGAVVKAVARGGYIGSNASFDILAANSVSGTVASVDANWLVNTTATTTTSANALKLSFTATTATVKGTVVRDDNGDGSLAGDATGMANVGVFNDTNNDGIKQVGEASATSDANGVYSMVVTAGAVHVRVLPSTTSAGTARAASADGTIVGGATLAGVDLGVYVVPNPAGLNSGNAPVPQDPASQGTGYWMVGADGEVYSFGDAQSLGSPASLPSLNAPIIGMTSTPDGSGYWVLGADGGVFSYGSAQFYGSTGSIKLNQPAVSMTATPDGGGYWFVARDGGVFAYGNAGFFGSAAGVSQSPVVGMVATPDGGGYWLIAADGGVFAYGNARFKGSMGGQRLNSPIVGGAATHSGNGYWMVAADGGVFAFGDAPFYGSPASLRLTEPIVSIRAMTSGAGYTLIARDGGVFNYGAAGFFGNPVNGTTAPIVQ